MQLSLVADQSVLSRSRPTKPRNSPDGESASDAEPMPLDAPLTTAVPASPGIHFAFCFAAIAARCAQSYVSSDRGVIWSIP